MTDKDQISEIIKKVPGKPGVYKMLDNKDQIIYVGKAKDLKKRVKSYFQKNASFSRKTENLVKNIIDIDWIIVKSELEALILETNLIKEFRPKYNILMKDDKSFSYLKIWQNWDFPKIEIVRQLSKDGALYFGPKVSGADLHKSMDFLRRIFPLHSCNLKMTESENGVICKGFDKYPCIEYQMKRCAGPCIGKVSKDEYRTYIDKVISFFKGDYEKILKEAETEMKNAAKERKFERAAKLRDLIQSIDRVSAKQVISDPGTSSQDIIGIYHDLNKTFICLLQIRAGKMINNERLIMQNDGDYSETIRAFVTEFYVHAADLPKEIIIPQAIEDSDSIADWFFHELNSKVKVFAPKTGKKSTLVELAQDNARSFAEKERAQFMLDEAKKEQARREIIELINKDRKDDFLDFPERMECVDISHYSGVGTVASLVVFINGKECKSEYRRYKIKTIEEGKIDDFASMSEVLSRRFKELEKNLKDESSYKKYLEYSLTKQRKKSRTAKIAFELKKGKNSTEIILCSEEEKHLVFEPQNTLTKIETEAFFHHLKKLMPGKNVWSFTKDQKELEKCGFKKLKTLEIGWEESPGLVPLSLIKHAKKDAKFAMCLKIEKTNDYKKYPDLILIDGGKGQLSSVYREYMNYELKEITLCSIAKRQEEVFFPGEKLPRYFPKNSEGSYLLQRMRDEAHRFALTYQKSLRQKKIIRSVLDDVPGIGKQTRQKLLKKYGSLEGIKEAGLQNLTVDIGEKLALRILDSFTDM